MKCRVCKEPAVVDVRRHNAAFCRDHFLHHCDEQVKRAIDSHKMLAPGERVLVAVSGGKDSLALWDILVRLGYEADGLYLGLGIGEYSDESVTYAREQARAIGRPLIEIDLAPRLRLRHPRRRRGHAPRALRCVRPVEAPPLQLGRARARLRRRRHRAQPRRRSRGAARQRAALGDRVPGPPASGAARGAGLRPQGEAARAAGRARDRGLLRAAPDRLPGRGVPDGRGQPPPRVQGDAQRRSRSARRARRPRSSSASSNAATNGSPPTPASSATSSARCTVCGAPTPGDVCAFCRLREKATVVPVKLGR